MINLNLYFQTFYLRLNRKTIQKPHLWMMPVTTFKVGTRCSTKISRATLGDKCFFLIKKKKIETWWPFWNRKCICIHSISGQTKWNKKHVLWLMHMPLTHHINHSLGSSLKRFLSLGCQYVEKHGALCRNIKSNNTSSQQGSATQCCTKLICYFRTSTDKLNASSTINLRLPNKPEAVQAQMLLWIYCPGSFREVVYLIRFW